MSKQRVIVCSALRHTDGRIITGPRHFDATMHKQIQACGPANGFLNAEQGFVDQFGVFLTREEAFKIANAAGQIRYPIGRRDNKLFSENLY